LVPWPAPTRASRSRRNRPKRYGQIAPAVRHPHPANGVDVFGVLALPVLLAGVGLVAVP